MGASSSARRGESVGNSLTPELPLVGLVRGKAAEGLSVPERGRWVLPVAMKALDRVMSRKEAAILMGISEPKVSALAKGEDDKSFSLLKLGALGDAFWVALVDELRSHFGLDDPEARVKRATEMVSQGMAMLVAEAKR